MDSGKKEGEKRVLVVDDDDKLRELVIRYLSGEGFVVNGASSGQQMDRFIQDNPVDLIVLDLMLPGEDGLSIARRLRANDGMPIIMLSARSEEVDRIVGLEVGADDYLAKPFNPRELLARIRAILRRVERTVVDDAEGRSAHQYRFGDFTFDRLANSLTRGDEVIELTPGDATLLEAMVSSPNRVLSRDQLIEKLKGYERSPFDRSIDVRVTRLRKKIEPNPEHPQFIRTVWGKGYMFTPQGNLAAQ
jgi:DNA-binding response OmpR family regulator